MNPAMPGTCQWEHFQHGSDIGIRGRGPGRKEAFEQGALALTAVVADLDKVRPELAVKIQCAAAEDDLLFLDWINALIFEMATRNMLFSRFEIGFSQTGLKAQAWGELVDIGRHHPAVEPKGATFTALAVGPDGKGNWIAQCVVDV
jgi:tRNA nucleotidyltransferase (CCA-adding enzyme)